MFLPVVRLFPVARQLWTRLLVAAALVGPRMLQGFRPPAGEPRTLVSQPAGVKVTLRPAAQRFASCLSRDDVDVQRFITAADEFVQSVERFGDFTSRGVNDARKNLRRVEQAAGRRYSSMRAFLMDEARRGLTKPGGGPASSSGAEALLWSRLSISLWVELFKEHLRSKKPLADAFRSAFQRSIAPYLDRFGRAAFAAASAATPGWDIVRERTQLGCKNGVCSDEHLTSELRAFVEGVEPVIERLTQLQKSVGLEDPRTP